jgi:ATP-dependent DNA helicase RecQ
MITRKGKATEKKPPVERISTLLSTEESERMRVIKEWRREYAKSLDMPAFIIFSNRTLDDLARKAPKTLADLEKVYGLGPQKIEAFGTELLRILRETV